MLNASAAPAEVAARAGNSVHVLESVYAHCTDGRDDLISQQIEDALDPDSGTPHVSQCATASAYTHRRYRHDPVRHMSVNDPERPRHGPRPPGLACTGCLPKMPTWLIIFAAQKAYGSLMADIGGRLDLAHPWPTTKAGGLRNRSLCTQEPVTQSHVTGSELRKRVAGVGFEPT